VVFVAVKPIFSKYFFWPEPLLIPAPTVGEALYKLMAEKGWQDAGHWRAIASEIAPTL
jgi:DNA (cytosine-5)-methyltransferase 1